MFDLGAKVEILVFSHNFEVADDVFGTKIAQQSISCGDNCTPQ